MVRAAAAVLGWLMVTNAVARAETTDASAGLAIREVKTGELAFSGPVDHFSHRFTIIALTAEPATILDLKVPDFSDGVGTQIPTRWSWIGASPKVVELRTPAEILVEAPLPTPTTYSTTIEIVYSLKDAAGKESIRPLRVPLRFERTSTVAPALETELAITTAPGDTFEVTIFTGPATAEVEIGLRGTGAKPVKVDKATFEAAPRKGSGSQLHSTGVAATVRRGLPIEASRDEIHNVELEVSGLEGPGAYEGKVVFGNSTTAATKEVSFTILVKRSSWIALALIALGVVISWRTRGWLQKGRALALARRDLGQLRDALSRTIAGDLGDTERNAAAKITHTLNKLLRDIDEAQASELEAAVARLWKRVGLLQAVVEARRVIALLPPDSRRDPSLTLESIAGALGQDLDDAGLKAQQDALAKLDLEKTFRAAVEALATTLRDRLKQRQEAHPELEASWKEARAHLDAANASLTQGRILEARGSLATGYRVFTRQLGKLLADLAEDPPPRIDDARWRAVRADVARILGDLAQAPDAESATELHARALTRLLRAAAPALAAAARAEANQRPSAKSRFDELAGRADALVTQTQPDADDTYRQLLAEYTELVASNPQLDALEGLHPTGAASISTVQVREIQVDAQLSALRTVLPGTDTLDARITASNRVADIVLLVLAVLTGFQLLWIGNATWGTSGDLLAAFLWGAGVHSIGQQVARGVLGLEKDWSKTD